MFRKLIALFMLPLLAACGNSEDFSINVDRSAAIVGQELGKIDPNVLVASSGLTPVKTESEDGTIRFILPSPEGNGELVFEVIEAGPQASTVKVALDIPMVTRDTGSADTYEYLAEDQIETALREALAGWKEDVESTRSTDNALAELSELVSTLAIGLQDFDQFESLAGAALFENQTSDLADASTQSEWAESGDDWGGDNSGWAEDDPAPKKVADDTKEEESDWGAGAS